MSLTKFTPRALAFAAALVGAGIVADAASAQHFVPLTTYRTGAYAVSGIPIANGMGDYFRMLNARDGGIRGVAIAMEECETSYAVDRFVECYERLKNNGPVGAAVFNPYGTGLTYAVIDRAPEDQVPIISLGYGRTDASDGRVFPYVFPLLTNYWSQSTAKMRYIGNKEGGMEKLRGKKIANVHHDSAYGKETRPILEAQAEKFGFEVEHFPVAHPGLDQRAVWLNVRRYRPDWVILRGWGVMNQTALREAGRVGVPADRLVGVWWSCSEADTVPAGALADGYVCAGFNGAGTNYPVIKDILTHVYDKGDGGGDRDRVGEILYNRGVVNAILIAESIRNAMKQHGDTAMSGAQVRDGIEALDLTDSYIRNDLGADGLLPPLKISCADHEGGSPVIFLRWEGAGKAGKFVRASDWVATDQSIVRPLIEASAAGYAEEKGITPRTC